MTPKEKAKELVEKMAIYHWVEGVCKYEEAKQCALIAVDEMYNIAHSLDDMATVGYLVDVKQEIEKL
jgi:hypothetical protein